MSTDAEHALQLALALPAEARATIADELLSSLDLDGAEIDRRWAEESRRRLDSIRAGSMGTCSIEEAFAEFDQP